MPKIKRDHPISKGSVNLSTLPYNSKKNQRRCKVVCSRIMSFSLQKGWVEFIDSRDFSQFGSGLHSGAY